MSYYKAYRNEICDQSGKQIAVVMAVACSKKAAAEMAAFAAQQMNVIERNKVRAAIGRAALRGIGKMRGGAGE